MSSFEVQDVLDRFPSVRDVHISPSGVRSPPYPTPPPTVTPPSPGQAHYWQSPAGANYLIHNDLKLHSGGRRSTVLYNFASGTCQRARGRRRSAIAPECLTEPATQPHTRALRIVSRQLPWRTEVLASNQLYVTVGDVLRAVQVTASLPVNEPEFNIISSPRRRGIRATFRRRCGCGEDASQRYLLRVDALGECIWLGGMTQDDAFVARFHNGFLRPDEPPVFVMKFVDHSAALRRVGVHDEA